MPDDYDYVALLTKTVRALRDMDEHFTLLLKDLDKARARSFAPSPAATTVHAQFKELSRLRHVFEKLQKHYSDASRDLRATRALAAEPGACFAQFAVKIEKGVRELHRRARKVELHADAILAFCRPSIDVLKALEWPDLVTAPPSADYKPLHTALPFRMRR